MTMSVAKLADRTITFGTQAELGAQGYAPGTAAPKAPAGSLAIATDVQLALVVKNVAGVLRWEELLDTTSIGAASLVGDNAFTGSNTFAKPIAVSSNDGSSAAPTTLATLSHSTTGTAAAGIAVDLEFDNENDGGTLALALRLRAAFATATAGAEDGQVGLFSIRAGAVEEWLRMAVPGAGETSLYLLVNRAGVFTLDRIALGAADSGGLGFKALVVAN